MGGPNSPNRKSKKLNLSLLSTTNLHLSAQRSRVFKACETCRQRKVRCNGVQPCQSCIKHSTPCVFRKSARRQLPSPDQEIHTAHSAVQDHTPPDSDDCVVQSTLSVLPWGVRQQKDLKHVLDVLKIDDSFSGRGKVTKVFSFTSTITILNLILDLIAQLDDAHLHILDENPRHTPHADVLEYLHQVLVRHEVHRLPPFNPCPPGPLDTVPLQLQSIFLERYIATNWKILPFQSPSSLRTRLSSLSCQPTSHMQDKDKALRAIMFPLLAIGSITTGHAELGDMLSGEAQGNTITPYYMGDLLALQSDLLMISEPFDFLSSVL
ncbi:uncharacterized protein N7496_000127 [Penicillium cataractarum]|uniref:Zn(2)-C6 fungal-type domain-containing protein n=1 Tax=Penicillium cataractarum TaxID=2100454 RepID=A0A9X0B5M0_9EURO|nr:uncharacterized protein N7496_000127 [Penicillium cataractarum]KAJ5389059.1 hypothetical protein N7496_000127 [Penicillium cataractarum]